MRNILECTPLLGVLLVLVLSFQVAAASEESRNVGLARSSRNTVDDSAKVSTGFAAAESDKEGTMMTATFGMGCFWGPDALFGAVPGVIRTRVGYAGGSSPDPEYYSLGDHTETFQVDFDPSVVSYRELLDIFWNNHSPSARPWSRQYMSMILFHDQEQERAALQSSEQLEKESGENIYTEIAPLREFYRAEDYHQKYALRQRYRVMNVLSPHFSDTEEFTDSPLTARLNAYVAGHIDADFLRSEMKRLGVEEELAQAVLTELGISS